MTPRLPLRLGALVEDDGVWLRLWAPEASRVEVVTARAAHPLEPAGGGYFELSAAPLAPGDRYRYRVDGGVPMPDPASRFQPEGAHGPSQVVDPARYPWTDAGWTGVAQRDLIFYELHVGTFSPEGTFEGARRRLSELSELGITAVELMPVTEFPGRWNWGYDHAALYAPCRAYGDPEDLRALIDEAHRLGLAVFLDVIHNHFGPDGAYLCAYAPMYTDTHRTPWGAAVNLDGPHSRGVRDLLCDSALHWLREYHADGLRLDAVHALCDDSEPHFLAELSAAAGTVAGPRRCLIAEDNRNERAVLDPRRSGGYGIDAVWSDDFHHQLRNITAGDTRGYFADFAGTTAADIALTLQRGWFHTGAGDGRGTDPEGLSAERFVFCIQNHDQIGNRPDGTRLNHHITPPLYRAVSALLLFAPQLPLLFMGQEWAATTPFLYFTDHHDELGARVSAGRKEEFADFEGFDGQVPDPQERATFAQSRLSWEQRDQPAHAHVLALYRDLLRLRKELQGDVAATAHGRHGLALQRGRHHLIVALAPDVIVPRPDASEVLLHTEQLAYAPEPSPPDIAPSRIQLRVPGAVLMAQPPATG